MLEISRLSERIIPALTRFVNSVFLYDSVTDWSLIRSNFLDPNFDSDLTYIAIEGDRPIGVALAAVRTKEPKELVSDEHAWLKLIAVSQEGIQRGVADDLLDNVERDLKEKGYKDIRATDFAGWQIFPGINVKSEEIISFLVRRGYRKVSEVTNLIINLSGFAIPKIVTDMEETLVHNGYAFRIPNPQEKERVVQWISENFGPISAYEALMAFRHNIPGLIVAEREGRMIGFSTLSAFELDSIGPIASTDLERGNDVGTILLYKALWELKLRGQKRSTITFDPSISSYSPFPDISDTNRYWIFYKRI